MISGFNTDVEFKGTVYHVQTEDKGLKSRIIISLVYDGGTILASKRASYDDLVIGDFDEQELSDRLSRQHQLICAAVKAGRINELREMTARSAAASAKVKVENIVTVGGAKAPHPPLPTHHGRPEGTGSAQNPVDVTLLEGDIVLDHTPAEMLDDHVMFDGVYVIEDDDILPPDAVAVVSELSGKERKVNSKLSLEFVGEAKFRGGDRKTVNIMICRGTARKVVADAQIMVKVLGSSFRPIIFHAKSDTNGLARIHLQVPHFESGRAAVLVRAMTEGEEIELRRAITPA